MTAYPDSIRGIDPVADSGDTVGGTVMCEPADFTDRLAGATLLVLAPAAIGRAVGDAFADASLAVELVDRSTATGNSVEERAIRTVVTDHDSVDGVLVVVPRATDLATVPGPLIDGVPVGVVRADRPADLTIWRRHLEAPRRHVLTWAVLSMGKDAFLEPAGRLHERLDEAQGNGSLDVAVEDWRPQCVDRPALCRRLATGPALAMYLGHGRRRGWAGYQALRWDHVAAVPQRAPLGALLALTCNGLSTQGSATGPSFLERFVSEGRAGAVFGSVGDVRMDAIATVVDRLGTVLVKQRPATLGALLRDLIAGPEGDAIAAHLGSYRIVGLPIQPIR